MIILLGLATPIIFVFLPICKNLGKLTKIAIVVVGIPVITFGVSLLQVVMESPEQRVVSDTAFTADKRDQIARDCGTTKEQTEAWFETHKTGWAEHLEAGLKCIRNHQ